MIEAHRDFPECPHCGMELHQFRPGMDFCSGCHNPLASAFAASPFGDNCDDPDVEDDEMDYDWDF